VKLKLDLPTINRVLLVLLALTMATTIGFEVSAGGMRLPVTAADMLVALTAVGAALQLLKQRMRGLRLPPAQVIALVVVAVVALVRSADRGGAAKEVLQIVEYFLVAYLVFVNVTRAGDLRALFLAFAVATTAIVAWALVQYLSAGVSPFRVRGSFDNRNQLGAFLAIALPFLYGCALHFRCLGFRILLLVVVAAGLVVTLSGGALLVILIVLGILSALRGQRAIVPYLVALCLVALVGSRMLPRARHTDALFASIAPYVRDNQLLTNEALSAVARERFAPTHEVIIDHDGEAGMLPSRPYLAKRLLDLRRERQGGKMPAEDGDFFGRVYGAWDANDNKDDKLEKAVVAVRYRRWAAALSTAKDMTGSVGLALFGHGFTPYHDILGMLPGTALQYRTDEPDLYNIGASEPFTHNVWFTALLQMGLLGLLAVFWLVAGFLGRAIKVYGAAHSEFAQGIALGAIGAILSFGVVGLFTENLGRGLAIPFVFILATVALIERIVYGDPTRRLTKAGRKE